MPACSNCAYRAKSTYELKLHEFTHAQSSKHQCLQCNHMFAQACHLTTHMLAKHSTQGYKCTQCDHKPFVWPQNLRKHIAQFHGVAYTCPYCDASFATKRVRTHHVTTTHVAAAKHSAKTNNVAVSQELLAMPLCEFNATAKFDSIEQEYAVRFARRRHNRRLKRCRV